MLFTKKRTSTLSEEAAATPYQRRGRSHTKGAAHARHARRMAEYGKCPASQKRDRKMPSISVSAGSSASRSGPRDLFTSSQATPMSPSSMLWQTHPPNCCDGVVHAYCPRASPELRSAKVSLPSVRPSVRGTRSSARGTRPSPVVLSTPAAAHEGAR